MNQRIALDRGIPGLDLGGEIGGMSGGEAEIDGREVSGEHPEATDEIRSKANFADRKEPAKQRVVQGGEPKEENQSEAGV